MLTAVDLDPRAAGPSGTAGWYRLTAPPFDTWAGNGLVAGARPGVTVCHQSPVVSTLSLVS